MKPRYRIDCLALLLLCVFACDDNPVDPGDQLGDWVALTARIQGSRQIALVKFDDPSVASEDYGSQSGNRCCN